MLNFLKKRKCKHENVEIKSSHALTQQYKIGRCKDCNEYVKAEILWKPIKI